jgi:hypothetical protein
MGESYQHPAGAGTVPRCRRRTKTDLGHEALPLPPRAGTWNIFDDERSAAYA